MKRNNKYVFIVGSIVLSLVAVGSALAASIIGTNMSTTGTFTLTTSSTTAAQFQNAAGTTLFTIDTTNTRAGINSGAALNTTFEVGGTASAAFVLVNGAIQVAGTTGATVSYSRFGTLTTNKANYITAANDVVVSGDLEVRGTGSFAGPVSISGAFISAGPFKPTVNSVTAFNFQNAAGTTNVFVIDTTNTRAGINVGANLDTTFEVGGTASISGKVDFGGSASLSDRFELTSATARMAINGGANTDTTFEVGGTASVTTLLATTNLVAGGNTASSSTVYSAEFLSTGTTSINFGGSSATLGTCLQMKNSAGGNVYARINGANAWSITTIKCHP